MNEFQIAPEAAPCPNCETLGHEVNELRIRLAKIEVAADKAEKEIFNGWSGQAYELWKEIKGKR